MEETKQKKQLIEAKQVVKNLLNNTEMVLHNAELDEASKDGTEGLSDWVQSAKNARKEAEEFLKK